MTDKKKSPGFPVISRGNKRYAGWETGDGGLKVGEVCGAFVPGTGWCKLPKDHHLHQYTTVDRELANDSTIPEDRLASSIYHFMRDKTNAKIFLSGELRSIVTSIGFATQLAHWLRTGGLVK